MWVRLWIKRSGTRAIWHGLFNRGSSILDMTMNVEFTSTGGDIDAMIDCAYDSNPSLFCGWSI